ncbi:hypothetical protein M413DRAFT_95576 [Hebeloma cylindrosporum]|uniref:Nucleoporin Nup133/Nup155-like C-terminal domain-containing protein n=1 Tax=Hebeloma cylindrosporum TaxID=76867 RepID=A0A0C3CK56_HEBCY|nr:hypothetical protein M413DRAFT_95576 [Hebeloma cylindrosporum h7]
MATFSPSPAPRRSSRLQTRGNSPARSQRPLRFSQTPILNQVVDGTNSVASGVDFDDRASIFTDKSLSRMGGDIMFAKTDEMSVSFYANLPLEVKQVLRTSDFNKDPYSGEIDTVTGFALVASVQTCFVWQHSQGIPTCYIFSSPQDSRSPRPPFHALVPQGSSREPGLILVSAAGSVRFWDSIGIGLAGGENYSSSILNDMEYDEEVTNLIRADTQTFILSTSYGSLYRFVLTSAGGKYHLATRRFARPTPLNSFSRLLPSFLSPPASSSSFDNKDKSKHIHAVVLGLQSASGDREVWALANGHIQQWSMKSEGWEDHLLDLDLSPLLSEQVQKSLVPKGSDNTCHDLELSDLAVFDDQNIAVLVSYTGQESTDDDLRRLYALAELKPSISGFEVYRLNRVPYQTTSTPGPPVHPRIQLICQGSIIIVQFGDAVALCSRGSGYRDRLELKSSNDRTLGVGVGVLINQPLILTATTMMKISLDLEKIKSFKEETGSMHLIKSIMMQAIIYGSSPLNPLRFSFPPEINAAALMQGAQQLSYEVLKSHPEVVQQSPDMTAQLNGRKERLSWLIGFINENAALTKMSQSSRQQLAMDAEKLYASHQLWLSYNRHLSASPLQSVLKEAVIKYMEEIGEITQEDVMRVFFRSRVADIGKLLSKVSDIVIAVSKPSTGNVNPLLSEANSVIVTVLRSAFKYRAYNLAVYGIELPMIKPWSSRPSIIDTVLTLFDLTSKCIDSAHGSRDKEPLSQLPALAGVLFECIKERLDSLSSCGNEGQREKEELQQKISNLRPEVLETLRTCGHEEAAYSLAEHYQDFTSLVALCHRQTVFPPEENPNVERIQSYIQQFKEDFTTELFQWYIQHGEIRTMFNQEAQTREYLDIFFKKRPNIGISWIHDIGTANCISASSALLQGAETAVNLEVKHIMLSIGKLSYLAEKQTTNIPSDSELDAFHSGLDFISVQEGVLEELRPSPPPIRTRQTLEGQIDAIVHSKGGKLVGKNAFTSVFRDCLRQLLQGKALSTEDLVDILTLKDNKASIEDYSTSIHLLLSTTDLPEARKYSALRTVWRRVYLHDDWENIMKTNGVSDLVLAERLVETALFSTILSVLRREDGQIIQPSEALVIPSKSEIMSRWPGMSDDQVNSIIMDYNHEQDTLGDVEPSLTNAKLVSAVVERAVEALDVEEGNNG